jgi:Suppressor of fused protein (SUFU)
VRVTLSIEGFLERVWEYREETLFPRLFGNTSRGIFVIPHDMFIKTFAQTDVDPRWLHYGVFEYAPKHDRSSWVYVTSGMSTPWEAEEANPDAVSGLGCEFVLESSSQGDWAIRRLWQLMGYQILLGHGRYPGREPLGIFDRLPLRSPIWDRESEIQSLMIAPGDPLMGTQQLESGSFELLRVVGITDSEAAYARAQGGDVLVQRLLAAAAIPVTDPTRQSLILGNDPPQ